MISTTSLDFYGPRLAAPLSAPGAPTSDPGPSAGTLALVALGTVAVFAGAAALGGHLMYGDWACGFRTCVVAPGHRRGKKN